MEKIEYKGYNIQIEKDVDAENPREWDNLGTMICWHSKYTLGDKHTYEDKDAFFAEHNPTEVYMLPLFLYAHGGITISTKPFGDRWDSGQVGFIYVDKEQAQKEFPNYKNWKKLKAEIYKILEAEVRTYDQFLRGEVYGYIVTKDDDTSIHESCWGFYGIGDAVVESEGIVDWYVSEDAKKKDYTFLVDCSTSVTVRGKDDESLESLTLKAKDAFTKVVSQKMVDLDIILEK